MSSLKQNNMDSTNIGLPLIVKEKAMVLVQQKALDSKQRFK